MSPLLHAVAWSAWHFEPSLVAGALVIVAVYVYALVSRPAGEPVSRLRLAAFAAGALTIFLVLVSPLDAAADRLLSMHMLQHVALTTIGPPLVLLGLPPQALRRVVAARPPLGRVYAILAAPVLAATLFIANMWFWHAPPIYDAAIERVPLHVAMHLAFVVTGLVFWLPVIQPLPERARIGEGGRMLYLFAAAFPIGLLALLILASQSVVYDFYDTASPLWGVSPLADQQIAGVIMGSLGHVAGGVALTILFFRFLDREEVAPEAQARAVDAS